VGGAAADDAGYAMRHIDEYRDAEIIKALAQRIEAINPGLALSFMEVCGTHTVSIARYALKQMLPSNIRLISGPGCPVCVTSLEDIDMVVAYADIKDVIVATYGDMMRVPGSTGSLAQRRADGADVRVVYSAMDALDMAIANPSKKVILVAVGFETTAPASAVAVKKAADAGVDNFYLLCLHKTMPKALDALLKTGKAAIDGFILPGHVSTITGMSMYDFLVRDYGIGGVISGFEPADILESIAMLLAQCHTGPAIENQYRRVVKPQGNETALRLMDEVFEPCDAVWRGMGLIGGSGLKLKREYKPWDAMENIEVDVPPSASETECLCSEILCGTAEPSACPLFGRRCTPDNPVGACMVSSEGSCAAYYRYGGYSR